jgi:hypothetical protein
MLSVRPVPSVLARQRDITPPIFDRKRTIFKRFCTMAEGIYTIYDMELLLEAHATPSSDIPAKAGIHTERALSFASSDRI